VRKAFQNVTKWQKIRKDLEWVNCVFKVSYGILRKVGNPELVSENPRVGSSILSLGTKEIKGLRLLSESLFYWLLPFCNDKLNVFPQGTIEILGAEWLLWINHIKFRFLQRALLFVFELPLFILFIGISGIFFLIHFLAPQKG
jgi:hypothetical protein